MTDGGNVSSVNTPGGGSVSIGRDANGNVIVTGEKNNVTVINVTINVAQGGTATSGEGQQTIAQWGLPGGGEKLITLNLGDWLGLMRSVLAYVPLDAIGPRLLEKLVDTYRYYQSLPNPPLAQDFGKLFDRELKMKEVRDLFPSTHLVELLGPSGIGKTHMLDAMMQEVDRLRGVTFAENWCYLYANARVEGSYNALIRKIIADCGQQVNAGVRPEELTAPLATCLAGEIAQRNVRRFLFIIDDADALPAEDLGYLIGEDGPVGGRVRDLLLPYRNMNIVLHIILVARRRCLNQEMMKQHNRSLLRRIFIEPLDERYVREMLAAYFQGHTQVEMEESAANEGGNAIFDLTGGHPGAVKFILDELKGKNFILPVKDYPAHFQEDVVKMIQRQTTRDLSLGEYLALNVLGALRRFDINLVYKLIERGILPDDVIGMKINGDRMRISNGITLWLQALSDNTGLVLNENNIYHVHPVLCKVLPMDLRRHNRELLEGLHRLVFEIYDTNYLRLRDAQTQLLSFGFSSRPRVTLDALYYALCIGMPSAEVLRLASEYRELYCEVLSQSRFPGEFEDLAQAWNNDLSLHELARQQGLFGALDNILRQSVFSQE